MYGRFPIEVLQERLNISRKEGEGETGMEKSSTPMDICVTTHTLQENTFQSVQQEILIRVL